MPTVDELRAGFADPAPDSRVMMRWWWFGPFVAEDELARELEVMAGSGIGGVEIAATYALSAVESDRTTGGFLSERFLSRLRFAAETAHRLGLRFDITLGSGWSFGGSHITDETAARRLRWDAREVPPVAGSARGDGWIAVEDVDSLLPSLAVVVPPDTATSPPAPDVGVTHRRAAAADLYFVANTGPHRRSVTLRPRDAAGAFERWDARDARAHRALRANTELTTAVDVVTRTYGKRFTMQDLERANRPTTSGLRAQPSLRFGG